MLAGPSVEKRIQLAVELALRSDSLDAAINEIADYIGSGLMVYEAVPAAFGLAVAAKGNTMDAICAGVNVGYDTDTTATMIGAMMGALNGMNGLSENDLTLIDAVNHFDMRALATRIHECAR